MSRDAMVDVNKSAWQTGTRPARSYLTIDNVHLSIV